MPTFTHHVMICGNRRAEGHPRGSCDSAGTEALRNAVRHANARRIEVDIRYDEQDLRLRVRDDGKGIDPDILERGHISGHWGLRGMRERAKLIGGNVEVWSQLNTGTEVELRIPATSAYLKSHASRWAFLSRFWRSLT